MQLFFIKIKWEFYPQLRFFFLKSVWTVNMKFDEMYYISMLLDMYNYMFHRIIVCIRTKIRWWWPMPSHINACDFWASWSWWCREHKNEMVKYVGPKAILSGLKRFTANHESNLTIPRSRQHSGTYSQKLKGR